MNNSERKHHTPEEKVSILRRHLIEKAPVSNLCEEFGLHPTVFYRWLKQFFENGAAAFQKHRPAEAGSGELGWNSAAFERLGRFVPVISYAPVARRGGRRLVLSERYFFVTCHRLRRRVQLDDQALAVLARVLAARRREHDFLLTAWVFLPDPWPAILGPRYPATLSRLMEAIKVGSTRRLNTRRGETGRLWQGRFFDRALRTVKEYHEGVASVHSNPVRRGRVARPEDWPGSSVHDYGGMRTKQHRSLLQIDRVRPPAGAGRVPLAIRSWRDSPPRQERASAPKSS